jgi:ParB family transcriptional regulator, chromosome partitioning protein
LVSKNIGKKGKFAAVGKNILRDRKPKSIDDFLSNETMKIEAQKNGELRKIEISQIFPDQRYQPRKNFNKEELKNLSTSIKNEGLLQPVIINQDDNGKYWLIAGERRFRACKMADFKEVEAKVYYRKDPSFLAKIAVIENVQRENLNPIEEAMALQRLIDSYGYNQQNIADELGKDRTTINQILSINKLPDEIKKECLAIDIPKRALVAISRITNKKEQLEIFNKIKKGDISSEGTRKKVKKPKKSNSPLVLITIQKTNDLCKSLTKLIKEKDTLNITNKEMEKFSEAIQSLETLLKETPYLKAKITKRS